MAETSLLTLALAAQETHARLSADAGALPEEARFLIDEIDQRLQLMVATLRGRKPLAPDDAIADRIRHLLTAIESASDLLVTRDRTRCH